MSLKKFIFAAALAAPLFFSPQAQAGDYCREYTRSIRVNGIQQTGYGQACLQPDGSWMIVSSRGDVDPFEGLHREQPGVVLVSQQQPVYYRYGPALRPVTYYAPPRFQRPGPRYNMVFYFHDDDRRRNWHKGGNHWGKHDRGRDHRRDGRRDNGHHGGRGRH